MCDFGTVVRRGRPRHDDEAVLHTGDGRHAGGIGAALHGKANAAIHLAGVVACRVAHAVAHNHRAEVVGRRGYNHGLADDLRCAFARFNLREQHLQRRFGEGVVVVREHLDRGILALVRFENHVIVRRSEGPDRGRHPDIHRAADRLRFAIADFDRDASDGALRRLCVGRRLERRAVDRDAEAARCSANHAERELFQVALVGVRGRCPKVEVGCAFARRDVKRAVGEGRRLILRRQHGHRNCEHGLAPFGIVGPRAVGHFERDGVLAEIPIRRRVDKRRLVFYERGTVRVVRRRLRGLGNDGLAATRHGHIVGKAQLDRLAALHHDLVGRAEHRSQIFRTGHEHERARGEAVDVCDGVSDDLGCLGHRDSHEPAGEHLRGGGADKRHLELGRDPIGVNVVVEHDDVDGCFFADLLGGDAVVASERRLQRHIVLHEHQQRADRAGATRVGNPIGNRVLARLGRRLHDNLVRLDLGGEPFGHLEPLRVEVDPVAVGVGIVRKHRDRGRS